MVLFSENFTNLVFSSTVWRATRRGWQKTGNTVVEETALKLKSSSSTSTITGLFLFLAVVAPCDSFLDADGALEPSFEVEASES